MDKTNEDNMFRGEIENTIKSINPYLPFNEAQYFIECIERHFLSDSSKIKTPRITIVGSSVPEEIIYACGGTPFWILGGSFTTAVYADYAVPRDTDPISKSSLGFLLREQANDTVVIPLVNDSSRKLVYLLESAGKRVITIDIPPMKSNEDFREYERQIRQCVKILGRRNKRLVTKRALNRASDNVFSAYEQIAAFESLADKYDNLISGIFRLIVNFSYYCTDNLSEWKLKLSELNKKISAEQYEKNSDRIKVLLAGSPIYFPNYKIPFLVQEAGLHIIGCADYTYLKPLLNYNSGTEKPPDFWSGLVTIQSPQKISKTYIRNKKNVV